jgi:hypothetical protein
MTPFRIWTLAMSTVTQLLRMKIIVFLVVFCVIVVAAAFAFPVMNPEQQLKLLKDVSFGALQLFAVIIAIVATALLLPRDVEDRTLYTILAKPVTRLDYLVGKLLGVLIVIASGLIIMDIAFSLVLWIREGMVLADAIAGLEHDHRGQVPPDALAAVTESVQKQGLTWSLHLGVWAIFLKAAVLASLALLISSFASSTLFTVVTAFCFAILGHGQGLLRDFLFKGGISYTEYAFAAVLAVVCPDLGLFDAVDAVISGHVLSLREIGIMTSIGTLYVVGYTVVAYLVFVEKEL